MSKRKPTPDVMSDLLGGQAPDKDRAEGGQIAGKPEHQNTIKPEEKMASKPAHQKGGATPRRGSTSAESSASSGNTDGPSSGEKLKVTFYVSQELADRLEEAWMRLRLMADKDTRTSISKSGIVERAVEEALDELEQKGKKSRLGRSLLK